MNLPEITNTDFESTCKKNLLKNTKNIEIDGSEFYLTDSSINEQNFLLIGSNLLHIITNSYLDRNLAISELELVDIFGYTPYAYSLMDPFNSHPSEIAPPLVSLCVNSIFHRDYHLDNIRKYISSVRRFYNYVIQNRKLENSHLVFSQNLKENFVYAIGQLPSSSKFHEKWVKKSSEFSPYYFDLSFNVLFTQGIRMLSVLYSKLKDTNLSNFYSNYSNRLENDIITHFWNDDQACFTEVLSKDRIGNKLQTSLSLIPLYLEKLPQHIAYILVDERILNEDKFMSNYLIPFISLDQFEILQINLNNFTSDTLNWLIILGLRKHGFINISQQLFIRLLSLVNNNGFYECYDPNTGKGIGKENAANSTIIMDLINNFIDNEAATNFILDREWTRNKRLPNF